ncbi:hypothetical protein HHK36_011813 [Tetracentron sinense]|uniref:Uncharacterized protein n=1 Tax=Tetracentron sinense TaxID=13715 RepID=A0A834ZA31_TETSI|nr:hypothetical protein HHK36_011813 [Tetracentron sinense]
MVVGILSPRQKSYNRLIAISDPHNVRLNAEDEIIVEADTRAGIRGIIRNHLGFFMQAFSESVAPAAIDVLELKWRRRKALRVSVFTLMLNGWSTVSMRGTWTDEIEEKEGLILLQPLPFPPLIVGGNRDKRRVFPIPLMPSPRMDSPPPIDKENEFCDSLVDPFLKEALQNPRHRLTVLRMELDIQRFMQNPDQQQFEFQHFPTSYLRLAAHRVAQHYGLQSMVLDNLIDGLGTRIVVRKTDESRYPTVCLSEVPVKQPENDKPEVKIAIRPRPYKVSPYDASELGIKCSPVRTMEERKEEYDRARARIFSSSSSPDLEGASSQATVEGKSLCFSRDESEGCRNPMVEPEKTPTIRDGCTSFRVAIFRDREKDRTDPDYDRSYERYVRGLPPNQSFSLGTSNMQNFQPSFVQYESGFPQLGQLPRTQTSLCYRPSSSPTMSPFCSMGSNQTSRDAIYMQWPSPAMMHAQSHNQFRHPIFQAFQTCCLPGSFLSATPEL